MGGYIFKEIFKGSSSHTTLSFLMGKIVIHNEEGYKEVKSRLTKGAEVMADKWFAPEYQQQVIFYNELASAALRWELDHNLLPIRL